MFSEDSFYERLTKAVENGELTEQEASEIEREQKEHGGYPEN